MKKRFPLLALLLALGVACCCHSCSETQDTPPASPDDGSAFPLYEIRRSFARDYAAAPMTRAELKSDRTDILNPGYIRPQWDSVVVYRGENLLQASTAFDAEYGYCVLRWSESDSLLYPMPKRVVVLKDPETGKTSSYLRFLIPDTGNAVSGGDFTGLVLYTTLSGEPVTIGRYDAGELSCSLSVFDLADTDRANVDEILDGMENIFIARQLSTDNPQDLPSVGPFPVPPVDIIGKKDPKITYVTLNFLLNKIIDFGPNLPGIPPPNGNIYIDFGQGGGGSGGSGSGSGDKGGIPVADKNFPANPKIKYDREEVREILDLLNRDCMGQMLINAMKDKVTITSGYFGSSSVNPVTDPFGHVIDGYEIKMGNRLDPITVMEELMHVYQGVGKAAFRQAAINREVEAKLTWYIYCQTNNYKPNFASVFGGKEAENYYIVMSEHIFKNDLDNPAFIEAFDNAVGALRNIRAYKDESRYPYDPGDMDCKKLMELIKDCIKE